MEASVVWLTVTVDAGEGVAQVRGALEGQGLALVDVADMKFWVPESVDREQLLAAWLAEFPDRAHRPAVSVIAAELSAPIVLEVSVVAVGDFETLSYYQPEQGDAEFPACAVKGDQFFVAALAGRDLESDRLDDDPSAQAVAVFQRLGAILAQAGTSPRGLAHLFVWYRDHAMRDVVNPPFVEMFPEVGDRPARHSLVRALPDGEALQIEAMGSVSAARYCYTLGGTFHGGIGGQPNSLPFGVKAGATLYSAGTYGRDPVGGEIPDAYDEQLPFAAYYTKELLAAAGMALDSVRHVYAWVRPGSDTQSVLSEVQDVLFDGKAGVPIHVLTAALPGTNQIQLEIVATDR